jgi:hypothetical protein
MLVKTLQNEVTDNRQREAKAELLRKECEMEAKAKIGQEAEESERVEWMLVKAGN